MPGNRDVDVAVHVHAAHLAPVVAAAVDQLARHDAFREDPALVVDVLEEQVDRGQPLRQPALERLPLGGRDDARQQVVGKDALGALVVAVDREGDALGEERACRLRSGAAAARPSEAASRSSTARGNAGAPAPDASNISS